MTASNAETSTTRRSFSKSAFAAIFAIPTLSSLVGAQRSKRGQVRITTHDTPPPITLDDGSFEF
jgi:hypothetical protein